jgi:hypothetical protein
MSLAMTTTSDHPAVPVARRTRTPKVTSRRNHQADSKPRKVSFYLSADAIRRLGVAASMEDTDKSKVLERVIAESPALRRWVIQDRARSEAPGDGPALPESSAA